MYTRVLTTQDLPRVAYYGYLGLYIVAYILDDSMGLVVAVVTLSRTRLQERGGRWLELVSGAVMLRSASRWCSGQRGCSGPARASVARATRWTGFAVTISFGPCPLMPERRMNPPRPPPTPGAAIAAEAA